MSERSRHDRRLARLRAIQLERAALDAEELRLLAAIAADPDPYRDGAPGMLDKQWARDEVACVLRLSPAVAASRVALATELVDRLPDTVRMLGAGAIHLPHARRLAEAVRMLPAAVAAAVEHRVLARAEQQTAAQFGQSVRRAVLAADPRGSDERRRMAEADCRVVFRPQPDGVTELWALLPAAGAAALQDAIDAAARRLDADRPADLRRADALVALATGGQLRPTVNVTVSLSTLLAVDDAPGELDRYGPIPAGLARVLAHDPTGTWRRLVSDPAGRLREASAATYRSPAAIARHVRAVHPRCVFPGCRRRSADCDLDHRRPWAAGGPTSTANLQPLCRRHHRLKHEVNWRVWREPDGTMVWRSPTGRRFRQPPEPLPVDHTVDPPSPSATGPPAA